MLFLATSEADTVKASKMVSRPVHLFACSVMFFLPWASDIDLPGSALFSAGFNLGSVGLILIWFATQKMPFRAMPRSFSAFAVFILFHSIVVYGLIHSSEFFADNFVDLGDRVELRGNQAIFLFKIVVFFLTVFSVASLCGNLYLLRDMTFSLGVSVLMIFLFEFDGFGSSQTARFSGGYTNPNSFASVAMLLGYLSSFVVSEKRFGAGCRYSAGGLVAMSFVLVLLTASRSALVSVGGGVFVFLVTLDRRRAIQYGLIGLTVALVFAASSYSSLFGYVFTRFTSGDTTARVYIWADYLRNWREYIEIGVGLGREISVLKSLTVHGRIWVPHNTYLRVLVAFGLVGFVLFCSSLWSMVSFAIQTRRSSLGDVRMNLILAFLVSILIQIFFGDHFSNRAFWIGLSLVGAYFSVYRSQAEQPNIPLYLP